MSSTHALVGQTFGDYLILRHLGSGGMADVYLALQTSLDRQVAIKLLKPQFASDENYVRRFENEARSVASITHQNIVQIFEVGHRDGHFYIAQEYVPGRNLKQRLQRIPSLPIEEALHILKSVTAALARSADAGITHRDIKPENILLGDHGEVKVADFGLARRGAEHGQLELTQVGMTVGTPLYMSPEQVQGQKTNWSSDMYSLGVTAYHMLAGYPPFRADTALNLAMQHVNDDPPALEQARPDVPPRLASIVHRLLAKTPEERFEGFEALTNALDVVEVTPADHRVRSKPTTARVTPRSTAQAGSKSTLHYRGLLAAGIAGALLAIVIGGRRANPLARRFGETVPQVERKETSRSQHAYALLMNTEEAWKAVFEYFPPDGDQGGPRQRYYALNAKRQLARWYIDQREFDEALTLFRELAELDATDGTLRDFGQAGLAIMYFREGDREKAASVLANIESSPDSIGEPLSSQLDRIRRELQRD